MADDLLLRGCYIEIYLPVPRASSALIFIKQGSHLGYPNFLSSPKHLTIQNICFSFSLVINLSTVVTDMLVVGFQS